MSAIFGFSGSKDQSIRNKMADVLEHRVRRRFAFSETPSGTLGYGIPNSTDVGGNKNTSGIYSENNIEIVVAGQLISSEPDELLNKYKAEGIDFVKNLLGDFVLAIRDGNTFHLVRDGAGARTVYYGTHNGRFVFAVEPKGVLAMPGFPRRLRPGSVAQYLTFSFIPGYKTMLENLYELPAGHYVSFNGNGLLSPQRYFVFERSENEHKSEDYWVNQFKKLFSQAVADRIPDNEPVGLFLSGGIDSSVVAAEAAQLSTRQIKTYAVHFGKEYPNELAYSRLVAEHLGTDHEEVLVKPKVFLPRLREMIYHLDEPIGDPVTMPNFELSSHVSRQVRWVFNGEGGDPLFGGPKNIPMLLHHWYGGIQRDEGFRERIYLESYQKCYEDLEKMMTPEWKELFSQSEELEEVLKPFFRCTIPVNFLDKLTAMNIRLKGAHLILPKVERMAGAWGIQTLSPLFDSRLIRFSFQMPPTLKLDRGVEKIIIKKAYQDRLPQPIIDRPKSGMRVPVYFWLKGEMKRYAKKVLSPKNVRRAGIFNPDRVKQLLDYNIEERNGRYGLRLWMLITFEIWRRIVIENETV